jgi:hypothetical protein
MSWIKHLAFEWSESGTKADFWTWLRALNSASRVNPSPAGNASSHFSNDTFA